MVVGTTIAEARPLRLLWDANADAATAGYLVYVGTATGSYGIVSPADPKAEVTQIHAIVEKPAPKDAPSTLGVVGRYVLTPAIFDLLAAVRPGSGGEIQLTDAISALLARERVLAMRIGGKRYDCGSKLGYLKATVELGLRHPEVGKGFADFLDQRGH